MLIVLYTIFGSNLCHLYALAVLKKSKKDSKGIAHLKKDDKFYTVTVDKANILNKQFQSVFTSKSPLKLSQLSNMAVQNSVDSGVIDPSQVPREYLSSTLKCPIFQSP